MAVNLPCLVILTAVITSRMNTQLLTKQKLNISNSNFSELCVRTHNYHRSRVSPPASDMMYMTWDATLAEVAQDWASTCTMAHNPSLQIPYKLHPSFRAVGENIWMGSTESFSVENAIKLWVSELKYYTYQTNQCNGCGHYTQVVWANSYKVGCAYKPCQAGKQIKFVCNYGEAGNVVGRRPYQQGTPCSACPGKKCWNNLCYGV